MMNKTLTLYTHFVCVDCVFFKFWCHLHYRLLLSKGIGIANYLNFVCSENTQKMSDR